MLLPSEFSSSKELLSLIESCDSVGVWNSKISTTKVYAYNQLNSVASEFSPVATERGMVFTSNRRVNYKEKYVDGSGQQFFDILITEKTEEGELKPAGKISNRINHMFHDGPASFSKDGNTIYFTRVSRQSKKGVLVNKMKTYTATYNGKRWSRAKQINLNDNAYSLGHAVLNPKEDKLYFSSDMPNGQGGMDIYYASKLEDGTFGAPINLGTKVNSSGNDVFPTFSKEGDLVFASNGHVGKGGLDVFVYKNKEVINLHGLNSSMDDFGVLVQDSMLTRGLLSSNRKGGMGGDDIYSFETFVPITEELEAIPITEVVNDPVKGTVEVIKSKAVKSELVVTQTNEESKITEIKSTSRTTENTFVIYYGINKVIADGKYSEDLERIAGQLKSNKNLKITIEGHSDSQYDAEYNMNLSKLRANRLYTFFVNSKGIDKSRVRIAYFGEFKLINNCEDNTKCTAEQHQENRRAELIWNEL